MTFQKKATAPERHVLTATRSHDYQATLKNTVNSDGIVVYQT